MYQTIFAYFWFDPFKSPYSCFDIRQELANTFSLIKWFPINFLSLSDHYQLVCILKKYNTAFYLCGCIFF